MMIKKLEDKFKSEYIQYFKPISECSEDDSNKIALIDCEEPKMFHFDKISGQVMKEQYKCNETRSIDSIYFKDGRLFLIEFKNTKKIKTDQIKMKFHDSMLILHDHFYFTKSDFRNTEFIIVSKKDTLSMKENEGRAGIREHLNKLAKSSCPAKLLFLEKGYGIKVSHMSVEEVSKIF